MKAMLYVVVSLAMMSLFASQASAQDAEAENAALRTIIKAHKAAAPDYADVPRLHSDYANVERLEDDQADVPLLQDEAAHRRDRAMVARLR